MVASGVGQFSINVKSNLKDFYGTLTKAQRSMKELTDKKNQLQVDSKQLNELRDKAQRIAAEMKELRQQKNEIKIGTREVENAEEELKNLDKRIVSLNAQKLAVEADIQPIRTANADLYKTEQEIDRINNQKVEIDFSNISGQLDGLSNKVLGIVKMLGSLSMAGLAGSVSLLKDAVNEASDLEQNVGGVQKLFGDDASKKVIEDSTEAYKEAGISQNQYLEQSTTFSASLIKSLEKGQTKTTDSDAQKSDLEQKKAEIEKQIKQNSYNSSEANINISDPKAKKQELNKYKQNALNLKKEKDKIDEQIANLPGKTTEQINKLSKNDAQKQAADYAKEAIVDMSDNANVFGTDIGLIQNAYQGFAKNNFTMLDNLKLGFAGSQEGAMDLVNTYGGLDHKVTNISEVTMPLMIKSIHSAQEAMKISGTTTKEAAKTYEGSLNAVKAAWKDFLATGDAGALGETVPVYLDNLDKKLKELTPKIIDGVKTLVKELPPKLKPVIKDIQNILTQSLNEIFGDDFTKNFVDGMKPFSDIIKKVFDMLSKSTDGKKPDLSWVGSVIPDLLKLAFGLKSASLIFKGISFGQKIGLKIPSFKGLSGLSGATKEMKTVGINDLKSLGMKMLTIAGISANIYFAAKALEEVQNVGDLGDLQPKMLAIAEAVVGMGALATAAGFIAEKKPDLIISGLVAVAGISGTIYLAAKALQEVGDIDSDFGSIQSKIGQIALSITEIGVLAAGIGALMDTGVGAAVLASGLLAIIGIAGTIYLVAKALEEVSSLELNREVINTNLTTISEVLGDITGMTFDGNIFEQIAEVLSKLIQLTLIGELLEIGKELEQLQDVELDREKVLTSVTSITDSLSYISELTKDPTLGDIIGEAGKLIKDLIDLKILDEFIKISGQLKQLENVELDSKKIGGNIEEIKTLIDKFTSGSLVDSLKNFIAGGIKIGDLKAAYKMFKEFSKIADVLEDLQGRSLIDSSLTNDEGTGELDIIKSALDSISSFAEGGIVDNLTGLSGALDTIVGDLTKTFPPEFQNLGKVLAQKTNEGYKSKLDLQSVLSKKIKSLTASGAGAIGETIAKAINNAVNNNLDIGDKIHNSIVKALSADYSADIDVNLLDNKVESTSSSDSLSKYPSVVMASGGLVTHDSVLEDSPEKPTLRNGEYVVPKKIVDVLGVPFFDKLKSGQISRTFAGLAQSVSNTTSSVINNVYNNNTTQNLNMYTSGAQNLVLAGNRRFGKR